MVAFRFEPGVLDHIAPDSVLERGPLDSLAAASQLRAYRHEGFWECMDTYKDAVIFNHLWARDEAPWKVCRTPERSGHRLGHRGRAHRRSVRRRRPPRQCQEQDNRRANRLDAQQRHRHVSEIRPDG